MEYILFLIVSSSVVHYEYYRRGLLQNRQSALLNARSSYSPLDTGLKQKCPKYSHTVTEREITSRPA